MAYDYRDRMVEYNDPATGLRHTYAYNALGRRISKTVDADNPAGGTTTRYFYDGWRVIEEQSSTGGTPVPQATYVYGAYIDEVLTMRRDVNADAAPEDYWFHADDQFSTMVVTDSLGAVVEQYAYPGDDADDDSPCLPGRGGRQCSASGTGDTPRCSKESKMNKGILAGITLGLMMVAAAPAAAAEKGLAGIWEVAVTDGPPACLNIDKAEGKDVAKLLLGGGSPSDVEDLKIEDGKISFKAHGRTWTAKVEGDEMTGTAAGQDNEKKFTAKRFVPKTDVTGTWKFGKAGELKLQQKGSEVTGELGGKKTMPIAEPKLENGVLSFTLGKAAYKLAVKGDTLDGTIISGAGKERPFTAKRDRAWGEPVELFNGKNLDGWKPLGDESRFRWSVKDGIMTAEPGSNIVSEKKFRDFKLHVEFRVPEKGNSGVYLRGRHEIQVEDGAGKELDPHICGSIYGRIAPKANVCKKAGEWQTFDVVLIGQYVTVAQNGETIIDNQEIQGITGGAIDIDENAPGPIYLQGDHSGIEYRKITITPAKE